MPSLYHHEKLTTSYAERTDDELVAYAAELHQMRQETEIPRQHQVIDRLLGLITFEASQRILEQVDGTPERTVA